MSLWNIVIRDWIRRPRCPECRERHRDLTGHFRYEHGDVL